MQSNRDQLFLDQELAELQTTATNFAMRFISDSSVRIKYIDRTKRVAEELRRAVKNKIITPYAAAKQAQEMRNVLMDAMRGKSSDFGIALATLIKKEGKTLSELERKYAMEIFKKDFDVLNHNQRNGVWCRIVEKSGSPQMRANTASKWMGRAGRGLFALTAIIAVYHVAKSEDKLKTAAREAVAVGGGIAGSAALGATGLACGPAAIACVPIGIFVGGLVGANSADWAFARIWGY